MRIVHYTIGLYPKRTGGLNRYATDLIKEQMTEHKVAVLKPGPWKPWRRTCSISRCNMEDGIKCYSLINALPQSLLYGVKTPKDFIGTTISRKGFERFFEEVKPDILHLHTLMGMPKEALSFFKEKGVKIVYTSHDYFGICPKVNLINEKGELCEGPSADKCAKCNDSAPSSLFLRVRSSSLAFKTRDLVRWFKNTIHF